MLTIPTAYAGICPAPQTTEYVKNIIPEIFFGFYNAQTGGSGLDIGIRVDTGGGWVGFAYGTSVFFSYPNSDKVSFKMPYLPYNGLRNSTIKRPENNEPAIIKISQESELPE